MQHYSMMTILFHIRQGKFINDTSQLSSCLLYVVGTTDAFGANEHKRRQLMPSISGLALVLIPISKMVTGLGNVQEVKYRALLD